MYIYMETRPDCRISIGHNGIYLRLSKYMTSSERQEQYISLKKWAMEYIIQKKLYQPVIKFRAYNDGEIFKIAGKQYLIRIAYDDKIRSKGSLKDGIMQLTLSAGMRMSEAQRHKSYLVSRLIGNEFLPLIQKGLEHLNADISIHFYPLFMSFINRHYAFHKLPKPWLIIMLDTLCLLMYHNVVNYLCSRKR